MTGAVNLEVIPHYPDYNDPGVISDSSINPLDALDWGVDWHYTWSWPQGGDSSSQCTVILEILVTIWYTDYNNDATDWQSARTPIEQGYNFEPTKESTSFYYRQGGSGEDSDNFGTVQEVKAMYIGQRFAVNITANVYYEFDVGSRTLAATATGWSHYKLSYQKNSASGDRGTIDLSDEQDQNSINIDEKVLEHYYNRVEMTRDENGNIEFKAKYHIYDWNGCATEYIMWMNISRYNPRDYKSTHSGAGYGDPGEGKEPAGNNFHWQKFSDDASPNSEINTYVPWQQIGSTSASYTAYTPTVTPHEGYMTITESGNNEMLTYYRVRLEGQIIPGPTETNDIPITGYGFSSYVYLEPYNRSSTSTTHIGENYSKKMMKIVVFHKQIEEACILA